MQYYLFDLDFTLVPEDTRLLFANYIYRRFPWRRIFLLLILPAAALTVIGLLSRSFFNRVFFCFLAGFNSDELDSLAEDFTRHHVPFYKEMLDQFQDAKEKKATVILATASPAVYIMPLARHLGADITLCTEWKPSERQRLLPSLRTEYNKGPAKIRALIPFLPESIRVRIQLLDEGKRYQLPKSIAFSDSVNDLPMLFLTEKAVVVHPGPLLHEIAKRKYWQIVRPEPSDTQAARRRRALFQMLGIFRPEKSGRRFSIASNGPLTNLHSQL